MPRLDEYDIPKATRYEGSTKVDTYDLAHLRPLKGARPMAPYGFLAAHINTQHHGDTHKAYSWVNTLGSSGGGFYRRTYESLGVSGQMVPALARARSLAVRNAIWQARMLGYPRVVVHHES